MMNLDELLTQFPTETACKDYLVGKRWPDGKVVCPRCETTEKVYKVKRPWRWICKSCNKNGYGFSPLTGTVFEDTKYPLRTWFIVAFLMLHSKKGMSARQIHRTVFKKSSSYETVWYMCTRIRAAMMNDEFGKLTGIVEIDETYVGGSDTNRHRNKKIGKRGGGPGLFHGGKVGVIGAIARKGNVTAQVIERLDRCLDARRDGRPPHLRRRPVGAAPLAQEREPHEGRVRTRQRAHREPRSILVPFEAGNHGDVPQRVEEILALLRQ
jgi:transposase-like protein